MKKVCYVYLYSSNQITKIRLEKTNLISTGCLSSAFVIYTDLYPSIHICITDWTVSHSPTPSTWPDDDRNVSYRSVWAVLILFQYLSKIAFVRYTCAFCKGRQIYVFRRLCRMGKKQWASMTYIAFRSADDLFSTTPHWTVPRPSHAKSYSDQSHPSVFVPFDS